jgi:tetratricopeptide (TPR) repeat protein
VTKHPESPAVVVELESGVERLAGWIGANPWLAGGILVGAIALAGAIGGYSSWRTSQERDASNALDLVRGEYLREMGAPPGAIEVPELANPKAGQEIRQRYVERFRELAAEQRGTAAGTLALLEAGDLLAALDRQDELAALYDEAASSAPTPALRALVLGRIAFLHEEAGRWSEAAAGYEQAAAIPENPLRAWALADAARCRLAAGDSTGALALYDRLQAEFPDLALPDHVAATLRELRAAAPAPEAPSEAAPDPAAQPGS